MSGFPFIEEREDNRKRKRVFCYCSVFSLKCFKNHDESIRDYFYPYTPEKPTLTARRQDTDQAQIVHMKQHHLHTRVDPAGKASYPYCTQGGSLAPTSTSSQPPAEPLVPLKSRVISSHLSNTETPEITFLIDGIRQQPETPKISYHVSLALHVFVASSIVQQDDTWLISLKIF